MENCSGFDLKENLGPWRKGFSTKTAISGEDLDELETHLRDSFTDLQNRGLTADEALLIATWRLGHATELDREFAKCDAIPQSQARAFWMVLGCFVYVAAMSLATIAAYFILWWGSQKGLDGIRLGWCGLIGRCMALGLAGWFGLHVLTTWGNSVETRFRRFHRHPVLFILLLVLTALGLHAVAIIVPNQVIFRTPTQVIGGFIAVDQLAGPMAIITMLGLLVFSATKFAEVRRAALKIRSLPILVFALVGLLAGGCSRESSAPSGIEKSGNNGSTPAAQQTAFEKCLATWSSGNQDTAVKDFLELNLRDPKLFSAGSALSMSEAQFAVLPAAAREKLSKPMLDDLQHIKALCRAVSEAGQQARASGDTAKAAKGSAQIKKLGERLDQPSVVLIAQKVGQALKKMAAQ